MKTIRYTLLMLLACLSLNSCQDVEEPANTVPTVVTDVVEKYSGNFAYVSGTVSSRAECYFLISTSEEMSDAQKIEVYPYKNEEQTVWSCFREIGDLQPGTTYYVTLCATDERSEVRGNTVSFTTSAYLSIESIKENGKDYNADIVGIYLATNQSVVPNFGNVRASRNANNGYTLPRNIALTEPSYKVYAYSFYNEGNSPETLNGINVWARGSEDYLYGSCDVTPSNPKANIDMHSALAKIHLNISTDSKESISISSINLRNVESEVLYISGTLDLATGKITPTSIPGHDGIIKEIPNGTIDATTSFNTEMQVIPTSFKDGEVELNVYVGRQLIRTAIPAATWEAGKEYEIGITINSEADKTPAKIGDYFYSDGTWSTEYIATKVCAGVVFALSEEENGAINPNLDVALHGRIVALNDVEGEFAWSTESKDLYFTNYSLLDGKNSHGELPFDGKTITDWTLPYGIYSWLTQSGEKYALTDYYGFNNLDVNGNLYPAINAAHVRKFNRTWYLPALGELARLGMACAAGLIPANVQLSGWTYWSSTEQSGYAAWVYSVGAGRDHNHTVTIYDKPARARVRPIASF